MAEVKAGMSAFGDQVATAKTQLLAFLTINWASGKVQEIVQIADAWNMMSARLKLATAGQREYAVAQKELFDIAQRIGVPIQETATLYGKQPGDLIELPIGRAAQAGQPLPGFTRRLCQWLPALGDSRYTLPAACLFIAACGTLWLARRLPDRH